MEEPDEGAAREEETLSKLLATRYHAGETQPERACERR